MRAQIVNEVREFITTNFVFREDRGELADNESLLEAGLIDSTGVLELVSFLESKFDIRVADADIVPENLDSIHAIVNYIERAQSRTVALAKAG